jgi:hypothetical protein
MIQEEGAGGIDRYTAAQSGYTADHVMYYGQAHGVV